MMDGSATLSFGRVAARAVAPAAVRAAIEPAIRRAADRLDMFLPISSEATRASLILVRLRGMPPE
jgi:hypothetical protein